VCIICRTPPPPPVGNVLGTFVVGEVVPFEGAPPMQELGFFINPPFIILAVRGNLPIGMFLGGHQGRRGAVLDHKWDVDPPQRLS